MFKKIISVSIFSLFITNPSNVSGSMFSVEGAIDYIQHKHLRHHMPTLDSEHVPQKDDRIAIVGAGPAGLHMAYLLKEKGFNNFTLLEERERVSGKSRTEMRDDEIPHEMGTCYTIPFKYQELRRITQNDSRYEEVLVPPRVLFGHWTDTEGMTQDDWIISEVKKHPPFNILPDAVATGKVVLDMIKYISIYNRLFSYEKDQLISETNKTFQVFLEDNSLSSLIPMFAMGNTLQGYGYIDKIPALYGLWWNSPPTLYGFIQSGIDDTKEPASLLRYGFQEVFTTLSADFSDKIITDYHIKSIVRGDTINITDGNDITQEFDFLILTSNLKDSLHYLDATALESTIFNSITEQSNLITTLFSSDVHSTKESIWTWTDSLSASGDGRLMTIRATGRILQPEIQKDKEHWVAYQYVENSKPKTPEYEKELEDQLRTDLTSAGVTNISVEHQSIWPYFSHFNQSGLNNGYPWQILDMQGTNKTWYAGASTLFESVHDCMEYNLMLVSNLPAQSRL